MIKKKCHKFTAFSQEILVNDVCVRRKSTIKSHPGIVYRQTDAGEDEMGKIILHRHLYGAIEGTQESKRCVTKFQGWQKLVKNFCLNKKSIIPYLPQGYMFVCHIINNIMTENYSNNQGKNSCQRNTDPQFDNQNLGEVLLTK